MHRYRYQYWYQP